MAAVFKKLIVLKIGRLIVLVKCRNISKGNFCLLTPWQALLDFENKLRSGTGQRPCARIQIQTCARWSKNANTGMRQIG